MAFSQLERFAAHGEPCCEHDFLDHVVPLVAEIVGVPARQESIHESAELEQGEPVAPEQALQDGCPVLAED